MADGLEMKKELLPTRIRPMLRFITLALVIGAFLTGSIQALLWAHRVDTEFEEATKPRQSILTNITNLTSAYGYNLTIAPGSSVILSNCGSDRDRPMNTSMLNNLTTGGWVVLVFALAADLNLLACMVAVARGTPGALTRAYGASTSAAVFTVWLAWLLS